MNDPSVSTVAQRLAACGAASVYEALERRFALPSTIRPLWECGAIAAPAFTVTAGASDNLALHRAVAEAPAGVVIVASLGEGPAAVWGSLLSSICRSKGIVGFVTNSRVRDTDRIRSLTFPVFCAGVTLTGPTKTDPGELQVTVTMGEVEISPSDLIVADGDGVVAVPAARALDTVEAAEAIETHEAEMVRRAGEGDSTIAQLGLQQLIDQTE